SSLIVDDVLAEAVNGIANTVGIPNCAVYLYNRGDNEMVPREAVGQIPGGVELEAFRERSIPVGEDRFLRENVERRRPIAVFDTSTDPRCDAEPPSVRGSKSALGVPLIARGELLGTAVLTTYKRC